MNKQPVLLIGASIRWAARSAAEAGYPVVGMDLFGDQDTLAHCRRFERIRDAMCSDTTLLSATIRTLARQEHAAVVRVGGLQAMATAAIEPHRLRQLAAEFGFHFPEIRDQPLPSDAVSGRCLFKKNVSTGGLGVRFAESVSSDSAAVNECHSGLDAEPGYWQRWIPGRSLGLVALSHRGRVSLLGMTQSIHVRHGRLPFVYAGSQTMRVDDSIPWPAMQTLSENIARQRGIRGLFNLDWIRDAENRWWLLEVNERPSASCELLERAAHFRRGDSPPSSLMSLHLDAIEDRDCPTKVESVFSPVCHSVHLKRIVYSRVDGTVDLSSLPPDWRSDQEDARRDKQTLRIHVADRPDPGTPVLRHQPIATVLIDAPDNTPDLARIVRAAVDRVRCTVTRTATTSA